MGDTLQACEQRGQSGAVGERGIDKEGRSRRPNVSGAVADELSLSGCYEQVAPDHVACHEAKTQLGESVCCRSDRTESGLKALERARAELHRIDRARVLAAESR